MCHGIFSRICHWGPIVALGIIKWVSLSTVYSCTMWWPPFDFAGGGGGGWGGLVNLMAFLTFSSLTTFHFFCAMCDGPGYLPKHWAPKKESDQRYLQYCEACQGWKAPRAHHCRKCGACVMKMDHHCPWINNCVGHFNHGHFIGFLFFAIVGCAQASYILAVTLYYGLHRSWFHYYGTGQEPKVALTIWTLLMIMFGLGLAIGVVIAVGALLFLQLRSVLRNQTGIEDWIIEKADYRRKENGDTQLFVNPYNLGRWRNLFGVLTLSCVPPGDGVRWETREGCDDYTLTREQLEQKKEKRLRTREYQIVRPYSGHLCPVFSFGFKIGCCIPCTDEPRIQLDKGDVVKVTRWKKRWLYGDKVLSTVNSSGDSSTPDHTSAQKESATAPIAKTSQQQQPSPAPTRSRGWFPRKCAVETADSVIEYKRNASKKSKFAANGDSKKDK